MPITDANNSQETSGCGLIGSPHSGQRMVEEGMQQESLETRELGEKLESGNSINRKQGQDKREVKEERSWS